MTSTLAVPGCKFWGGSTTSEVGEEASTIAGCPAIVTWLESASPQKLFPKSSKRSVNDATRGLEEISIEEDTASLGERIAVVTRPVRPGIEAKITPGFKGATKRARPVASVLSRSPFEKFTVTPGMSRPFTSSTASVARSPETIRRGSNNMRAPEAAGASCWPLVHVAKTLAMKKTRQSAGPGRCKNMHEIVVENLMPMKAMPWLRRFSSQPVNLRVQKNAEEFGIDLLVTHAEF